MGLISIHALREEGDAGWRYGCSPADISIHALREEGDICRFGASSERPISIHALREEGDLTRTALLLFLWIFLSTPSARRATCLQRL